MASDKEPTEFGGEPGRVQRGSGGFTHSLTPAEAQRILRATNPADPTDTPDAALFREWEKEGKA